MKDADVTRLSFKWFLLYLCSFSSLGFSAASLSQDCTKTDSGYRFHGQGSGSSKSIAAQGALVDARKNAIVCLFGGTIEFSSEATESNTEAKYSGKTSISVSSENLDWSDFQFVQGTDVEAGSAWTSMAVFSWSLKAVDENRKRLDRITKQKEQNRALSLQTDAIKKQLDEKSKLVKKQKEELDKLNKSELEIQQLKNEKDRILARLEERKKNRQTKSAAWIAMVTKFGCGITFSDLEESIGSPDKTEIRFQYFSGDAYIRYRPVIYFIYGDYALVAPVYDELADEYDMKYRNFLASKDRYQITYVIQYRGGTASHWICKQS
jgi:hypothetical protein